MSRPATAPPAGRDVPAAADLVDERIVLCYYVAALTFLTVSMLAGLLVALQLDRKSTCLNSSHRT